MSEPVDPEVFPPTLREVMLGQWQLSRAIDTNPPPPGMTEQLQPLAEITPPGEYLPEPYVGQRVSVAGTFVAEDFLVVSSRFNGGARGYWVTGQLRVDPGDGIPSPTSLAVAIGWTADRATADAAVERLEAFAGPGVALTGRLISDEGPALPPRGAAATEMTRMSPAALLGFWHDTAALNVYRPYLVADGTDALAGMISASGLVAIDSPAPVEGSNVNWLNIFYAAEWAIFAGFAFYMWYRLAKDAWEKEVEALEERAGASTPAD